MLIEHVAVRGAGVLATAIGVEDESWRWSSAGQRHLQPADFRAVTEWLADSYPELFAAPHLRERMEVYTVLHDLRQGIQFPEIPGQARPPWSPWNRLRATLAGASYLGEWV